MKKLFFYLTLLFSTFIWAQTATVSANKSKIKIGEEIIITIKTAVNSSDFVVFPETDSIGKLEVINSYKTESLTQNNLKFITKKYGITQFDAGKYTLPPIEVVFNKNKIKTNTLEFLVEDVVVDTTKQKMFDIKKEEPLSLETPDNLTPKLQSKHFLWFFLSLLLIGFVTFFVLKKMQKIEAEKVVYITPIDQFLTEIKNLKTNEIAKPFYSEITFITRRYFNRTLEISALESTTSQFIEQLKLAIQKNNFNVNATILSQLNSVFNKADMVKFAKIEASESNLVNDKNEIEKIINDFHQNLPQSNEEIRVIEAENAKIALAKKKTKTRNEITLTTVLLSIVVGVLVLGIQNIKDYYKFNYAEKNSSYFLEKKWISSIYGSPGLQIETPEILIRSKQEIQKSSLLKSASDFYWNAINDRVSIALSNREFNDSIPINNEQIINQEINKLNLLKAKITNKTSTDFKTVKGVTGVKNTIQYSFINSDKKEVKNILHSYYINGGTNFQIINLTFNEEDELIDEFEKRIENSLEIINLFEDE